MEMLIGPVDVKVLEFADFECPFCASFHKEWKTLQEKYSRQVSLTFVEFPLSMHRFAIAAARAAACAAKQGYFERMHDKLFDQQDQFGLRPWSQLAAEAGIPDEAAFERCSKEQDVLPDISKGLALGKRLNVQGTPTLVINGWQLARPPSVEELEQFVKAILAGKDPVATRAAPP